ncbi:MAG: hypothetical protein WDO73_01580 [Ignavibacteriota bacterium]
MQTRVPQVALLELLDALEAKIAAMLPPNTPSARLVLAIPEEDAIAWKAPRPPRSNGRPRPKPIHPFLNIEEL